MIVETMDGLRARCLLGCLSLSQLTESPSVSSDSTMRHAGAQQRMRCADCNTRTDGAVAGSFTAVAAFASAPVPVQK
jgi:hypothetical protein